MKMVQVGLIALGMAFLGLVIWASVTASFFASFAAITADAWGLVTLADLYLGFILIGCVVWAVEGPGLRAALIALLILVLGNVVTAVWLGVRLPVLWQMATRYRI